MVLETRERIMEAAKALFSRKGYLGATTREIAKEAGIAEVTLFRHFPTKEGLFLEIIKKGSFLPALKDLLPEVSHLPYDAALELIARKLLEVLLARRELIQIMHTEINRYPGKLHYMYHEFLQDIIDTLALYLKGLQDRGVLRDFDAQAGARAFLGMFFSFFNTEEILMRKRYRAADTEKVIREFLGIYTIGTLKRRSGV